MYSYGPPAYGQAKAGRPARTYIQQLCEDMGCSPEDLPEAMNDREKWRERVRDIRASGARWWWWWWHNNVETIKTSQPICMSMFSVFWYPNFFSQSILSIYLSFRVSSESVSMPSSSRLTLFFWLSSGGPSVSVYLLRRSHPFFL